MKKFTKLLTIGLILGAMQTVCYANENGAGVPADEAINMLKEGNTRFVEMKLKHPDQSASRRNELTKGQHPFVVVFSCSDSRVPPEVVFDQGLGDIFEVRNAGNVVSSAAIGSIEYAVVHCGVKLVVVMGHEDCGAVKAALSHNKESKYILSVVKEIEPAIKCSKGTGKDLAVDVEKNHTLMTVQEILKDDCIIADYVKNHGVKIVPAYYHIESGKVEFLK